MDTVTQQTAANAEESASASEELNAQSHALMEVVDQLQVLVGAASRPEGASHTAKRRLSAKAPVPSPRAPAPVVAAKSTAGFPLDDSEFKEF